MKVVVSSLVVTVEWLVCSGVFVVWLLTGVKMFWRLVRHQECNADKELLYSVLCLTGIRNVMQTKNYCTVCCVSQESGM